MASDFTHRAEELLSRGLRSGPNIHFTAELLLDAIATELEAVREETILEAIIVAGYYARDCGCATQIIKMLETLSEKEGKK